MIEKAAQSFSDYIIKNGADPNDKEIFEYSISSFLSSFFTYGTILLLAAMLHIFKEALIFMLFFIPLRSSIGGYHAQTRARCFVMSVLITMVVLLLLLPYVNSWILLPVPIIALITIFAIAPVTHPNHPLSEGYKLKAKKVARLIIIIQCILLVFIYNFCGYSFYNIAAIGILTAIVSALLAHFINKS